MVFLLTGSYGHALSSYGNKRLVTAGWQQALASFISHTPNYQRKFAYYRVLPGQTVPELAELFSVDSNTLASLNPGDIVGGTTIKIPPPQEALAPAIGPNQVLTSANVTMANGALDVNEPFTAPQAVTDIPSLAALLAPWQAIQNPSPGVYIITKPILIENNIRLDIMGSTVKQLELLSTPTTVTCLCAKRAEVLIQNTAITSYDPATANHHDNDVTNGRSFVRDTDGRMDIMDSQFSYLGYDWFLHHNAIPASVAPTGSPLLGGGTYGVSWRSDKYGVNISTGWIENSSFSDNYFGAFTFGASGITWDKNHFFNNIIYGLDPHDDSNNALVENNVFDHNGKHGFIMSKRCDYNIVRNNVSYDNKVNGFMLHVNSSYNLYENNNAYGNQGDNYVIYASNYNTLTHNTSSDPRGSGIRVSTNSRNNFITDNNLSGGKHGVYIYSGSQNTLVTGNTIENTRNVLTTQSATNVLFEGNTIDRLSYDIDSSDRMIFGLNTLSKK